MTHEPPRGTRPPVSVPHCPHRPPCPGCPRFGEPGIAASAQRALDAFAAEHQLPPVAIVSGATYGFRMRARLAIRGRMDSPKLGLFEFGSHRLVHIPDCRVHHPLINRVADVVRRALIAGRVPSYSEQAHLGLARYLQVVVERRSMTAQVVLVGNHASIEPFMACFEQIRQELGPDLHSLWFNSNTERTNTILGAEFQRIVGPESVVEHFGGPEIHYPPGAFGQNNLEIAERIVEYVRTQVGAPANIMEFYAGVGAIGLSLLASARDLRLNELSPHSLAGLQFGISRLGPADRAKVSVIAGLAGEACSQARGADVVIADPPRKGLDAALREYLAAHPPERFIYVSCGFESFIADASHLLARGTLKLASLKAFNLLPYTEHVETVACFERA